MSTKKRGFFIYNYKISRFRLISRVYSRNLTFDFEFDAANTHGTVDKNTGNRLQSILNLLPARCRGIRRLLEGIYEQDTVADAVLC